MIFVNARFVAMLFNWLVVSDLPGNFISFENNLSNKKFVNVNKFWMIGLLLSSSGSVETETNEFFLRVHEFNFLRKY